MTNATSRRRSGADATAASTGKLADDLIETAEERNFTGHGRWPVRKRVQRDTMSQAAVKRRFPLPGSHEKRPKFNVEYDHDKPPVPIVPYVAGPSGRVDLEGMPLGVMLDTMAFLVRRAKEAKDYEEEERLRLRAAAVAKEAAPYVHPKLATTTIQGNADAPLVVEELVKLVDERKPVELFLNEWQPKMIEGEAAD